MSTCTPVKDLADDLTHGQREARAVFDDDVTGVVLLTQRSSNGPLKIEGRLEGVPFFLLLNRKQPQ